MKRAITLLGILMLCSLITACPKGGEDDYHSDEMFDQAITLKADLYSAQALFSIQNQGAPLASESASPTKGEDIAAQITISDQSPLIAVTPEGLKNALKAYSPTNESAVGNLPRLSYVAVSPIGDVLLAFERPFIYTESADGISISEYSDPWSPSSPFTCQLFKVNKKINEFVAEDVSNPPGVTCITNSLELDTWDFRSSRIQFDDAGNAYFSAHVPNNWKNVLIKWGSSDGSLSEVINANICFRDFMVTGAGAVLYTGITSTSGECGGDDSFLRYMTPEGALQEVTRGWWDYTFTPIETGDYAGQIIFYGPDPDVATTPDWDDSCLFRFNPSAAPENRSTQLADCEIDVWRYVNDASDADKPTRCTETKNMMGGGNQPDKILLVDMMGNDGAEEVYVVGNIYAKQAGEWLCDICVNANNIGPCTDANGMVQNITTNAGNECTDAGYTWQTNADCYHHITTGICNVDPLPNNWQLNHRWCESPGNDWTETHSAVARVNDDANKTIIILSSTADEVVANGWAIRNRLAYTAFNTADDSFKLIEVDETNGNSELLSGIEIYELFEDPRDSTKWFINGLRFSDNSYIMGTFNPDADDPPSTLEVEEGVTGQIETLVLLPEL